MMPSDETIQEIYFSLSIIQYLKRWLVEEVDMDWISLAAKKAKWYLPQVLQERGTTSDQAWQPPTYNPKDTIANGF